MLVAVDWASFLEPRRWRAVTTAARRGAHRFDKAIAPKWPAGWSWTTISSSNLTSRLQSDGWMSYSI